MIITKKIGLYVALMVAFICFIPNADFMNNNATAEVKYSNSRMRILWQIDSEKLTNNLNRYYDFNKFLFYNDLFYTTFNDAIITINPTDGQIHQTYFSGKQIEILSIRNNEIIYKTNYRDTQYYFNQVSCCSVDFNEHKWNTKINCAKAWDDNVEDPWLITNYDNNILISITDKELQCHNLRDGNLIWQNQIGKIYDPTIHKDSFIYYSQNRLSCLNLSDGSSVWWIDLKSNNIMNMIYYIDIEDYLFVLFTEAEEGENYISLACFNINTGDIIWQNRKMFYDEVASIYKFNSNFIIRQRRFYSNVKDPAYTSEDMVYTIINPETGQKVVKKLDYEPYGKIHDGKIYTMRKCTDLEKGYVIWDNKNRKDELPYSIESNKLYFDNLEIIDINNGNTLWKSGVGGELLNIYNGMVYAKNHEQYREGQNTNDVIYINCFCDAGSKLEFKIWDEKFTIDGVEQVGITWPLLSKNRMYISIKDFIESLGGDFFINNDFKQDKIYSITLCTENDKIINVREGNPVVKINGKEALIDKDRSIVPILSGASMMLPARFLANQFNCDLKWDAKSKKVTVTYKDN